ncbi:MAG: hypothetical protein IMZ75_10385 [Actinobacteria bacterium]|nr:hypothetical protein [Actinomycetota bacterium]
MKKRRIRTLAGLTGMGLAAVLLAAPGAFAAPASKVDICHVTGDGSYQLINVAENAQPAHIDHGDVLAETNGLDANCAVVPTRIESSVFNLSGTGWAGWSCPTGTTAVGGGTIPSNPTYPIGAQGLAVDNIGGSTYPVYPHYTFTPPETGYVVQNGGTAQSIQVYVDCLPN